MQGESGFGLRSAGGGTEDDEGAVVVRFGGMAAEFVGSIQDGGRNGVGGGAGRKVSQEHGETLEAELFGFFVGGFENAIGGKDENVVGFEVERDGVVLDVFEHAERSAIDLNFGDFAIADENRARSPAIGNDELAKIGVVDGEEQGNVIRHHLCGGEALVENGEHFLWPATMILGEFAKRANGERGVERGGSSFAGYVGECEGAAACAVRHEVVEVTGQLTGGNVCDSEIETGDFAFAFGQKLALNFAGGVEVALEAFFGIFGLCVEAGIFESDGDIGTENVEKALVFGGERGDIGAFKIEDADEAIVQE